MQNPIVIEITDCQTHKGKRSLREHGAKWRVVREDTLEGQPALLTESLKDGYLRWWVVSKVTFTEVINVQG